MSTRKIKSHVPRARKLVAGRVGDSETSFRFQRRECQEMSDRAAKLKCIGAGPTDIYSPSVVGIKRVGDENPDQEELLGSLGEVEEG